MNGLRTSYTSAAASNPALLFRAGEHTCALNILNVLEIMRPLPVEELPHMPGCVLGLSIVRGAPTPVVSVASLFGSSPAPPGRFVIVRAGERRVALAVDEVLGAFELDPAALHGLPPLVHSAADRLEAVGALDAQLLFVLNSSTIVPDEVWQELVLTQS